MQHNTYFCTLTTQTNLNMKKLFSLLAIISIMSSCKKSTDDGGTGETYLPNTVGTNWTYKVTTGGTAVSTVKYTVSNRDTVALSRTYNIITGSNGTNQYYNKTGNDYFTFRSFNGQGLELNFLKQDKNVNESWSSSQTLTGLSGLPGGITSANINIVYTIKEKGSTKTVSGNNYSNVIKVEATINAAAAFLTLPLGTAEFYFAKGIGIIESKINLSNTTLGFNIDEKYELQSYEIK